KYRDRAAGTSDVDPLESWIVLDHVTARSAREISNRFICVEVKDRHQIVAFAFKESSVVLRIERHPMVSPAFSYLIAADDRVRCWVDDGKNVLVLEIDVDFPRDRVILGHSGFTVEVKRLDDLVLPDVDDCLGPTAFVRYVYLVKGFGVGAAIWLGFRRKLFYDRHRVHRHDSD